MRKIVTFSTILFLVWQILDAFDLPSSFLMFLLVGQLPGTGITLPPSTMLAITSGLIGFIIFESLARHLGVVRDIKRIAAQITNRRARLPSRRFTRV